MTPTRRAVLGGAAAAALAPRVAAAARPDYALRPREVAAGVWMVEGATEYFSRDNGGAIVNLAFLETEIGALVIDTGSTRRHGEALRTAAADALPGGVAEVLVTHHHPDHWFGNQSFADLPIRAAGETRAICAERGAGYSDNLYRLLGDWMRGTEPVPPTAEAPLGEARIGGRALRVIPLSGHTASDLAVLDEATGTLIAGDLAFYNRAPTTPDADLAAWQRSLDALEGLGAAAVLPGHGPLDRTGDALRQTRAYLDWLDETLRAAAEGGLDQMEVISAGVAAPFDAMAVQPREFARSVEHLFPDYERAALPLLR